MTPLDDLEPNNEPLEDAGGLWLQLVAAVDYFRRGPRPDFTVWDAIEEALRWHTNIDSDWTDPDPLLRAIRLSVPGGGPVTAADTFNAAIRRWLDASATAYNDSFPWELSAARRNSIVS
jgi:hypothetical protein